MSSPDRNRRSEYMQWAKMCSQARFNLAASGLTNVSMAEFSLDMHDLDITGPGGYGYAPLRKRIAEHTGATEECVVTANGCSMADHLALAALLDPGDEVLIERPAYGLLLDVAHYLGARVKRFERKFDNGFAIDPGEMEKALTRQTRLIVLSNLHNPTGAFIPAETFRAVGEIALRTGAQVLVDEAYLEMLFDPSVASSFWAGRLLPERSGNPFVATSSLTKAYGLSGLRCGWILAPPELARRIWLMNDLFGVNAPHLAERASVRAFDQLERFRARARTLLDANRVLLDQFLDSRGDLECFRPPGGTVVFPRLVQGDTEMFVKLLREKYETTVVPGRFFEMPQHFRVGIGGDTGDVRGGLERLSAALDRFGRR